MKIAFIGLGIMGRPMALNLLRGGHELSVWARRAESMLPLAEAGAHTADSPAAAAADADLVISMVADAPDVESVMLGANGVADSLPLRDSGAAPLVAVDMSTIAPAAARSIAAHLGERGIPFLDAPVSGGEVGAIAGTLSVMVGGDATAFAVAQPALACLGSRVLHIGASGAGQVTKAANQILTGVGVLAVAEALNFAARSGVDAGRVREALMGGFAASRILENHGQRMLDRQFAPGFKAWMHQKDLDIVLQSAHELGIYAPLSAATAQLFNALVGNGQGDEDSIAVLKLLESLSGAAGGAADDAGSAS